MATTTTNKRAQTAKSQQGKGQQMGNARRLETTEDFGALVDDLQTSLVKYGKQHPLVTAGAIFFAGFYVGWKIKPW
jgi:hypothetical protein